MKFSTLFSLLFASLLLAPVSFAESDSASGEVVEECGEAPEQPTIPNGRQASEEEMIAAQKAMKGFLAEGNDYIECLNKLERSWGDDATDEQKAVVIIFNNKIVDDQQAVADLFNAAVRAFKGKQGG